MPLSVLGKKPVELYRRMGGNLLRVREMVDVMRRLVAKQKRTGDVSRKGGIDAGQVQETGRLL